MNADDQRPPDSHPPEESGATVSEEAVHSTPGTQRVVRRVVKRRVRVRSEGFEGIERLNRLCKSIALTALLAVIGVGLFGRIYSTRFTYLPAFEAMEQADIANRLRYGDGFTTGIGQTLALDQQVKPGLWRDVKYNPVHPVLLSLFFRVRGGGDSSVALMNGLFHLLTGILVYLIGLELRGRRTAIIAVILYYGSVEAIGAALGSTGVSIAAFFVTLSIWAALKSHRVMEQPKRLPAALGWPALAGTACGLAYLSGGVTALLVVPVAVLTAAGALQGRRTKTLLAVGAYVLVLLPWVARNVAVSGTASPLLSQYKPLSGTDTYPRNEVYQNWPGEVGKPAAFMLSHPVEMTKKVGKNLHGLYGEVGGKLNAVLLPIVLLTGLQVSVSATTRRTWAALLVMLALQVLAIASYGGRADSNSLMVFVPLTVAVGTAGAVALIMQHLATPVWRVVALAMLGAAVLFPCATTLAFRAESEQPVETMQDLAQLKQFLAADALIATDIPPVVVWYTGRSAVGLPGSVAGLADLAQHGVDPDYLYLSHQLVPPPPSEWSLAMAGLFQSEHEARLAGTPINLSQEQTRSVNLLQRHKKLAEGATVERRESSGAPSGETPENRNR